MQEVLQGRQERTRKRQAPPDRTTGANDGNLGNRIKVPRFSTLGRNPVGVPLRSQQILKHKRKRKKTTETASPPQTDQFEDRSLLKDVRKAVQGAERKVRQLQQEKTKLREKFNNLKQETALLEQQQKALEEEKEEQACKIAQLKEHVDEQRESISQGQLALTNQQLFTEIDRTEMHTKYRRRKKICQQMRRAAKKWKRRTSRLAEKKEELQETLDQTRQDYVSLRGQAQQLVRTRTELERQKAQFGLLQEQHNRQTQQCRLQTATITRLHSEKLSLEGDLRAVKAQTDQLSAEVQNANEEKVTLRDKLSQAQEEEEVRLKTALEDCKGEHAREMEGKQVQLKSKEQELHRADKRNKSLDLENCRNQAAMEELEQEVADLETQLFDEKNQTASQARKLTKEANDKTLLKRDRDSLKKELKACSQKREKSELECTDLKNSLAVSKTEISGQYKQIQFLQEQKESLHQQNSKVKQRLDDSDRSLSVEADRVRSQATEAQSNHANNMWAL